MTNKSFFPQKELDPIELSACDIINFTDQIAMLTVSLNAQNKIETAQNITLIQLKLKLLETEFIKFKDLVAIKTKNFDTILYGK